MKLEGNISILVSKESTRIEIRDSNSITTFVKIELTPEQFCSVIGRLSMVDCELNVFGLERVGKKHENKTFEFKQTYSGSKTDLELACNEALFNQGLHEWVSDHYYSSQDTFFKKEDEQWVRVTIRRWI